MKIVQLITRMDELGGAQVHVRDLSLSLSAAGHEVFILSGSSQPVFEEFATANISYLPIKHLVRNINLLKDIKACIEVRTALKRIQPDLIATHSSKAGIIGRIAGWTLGIPTVFTAHGWAFTDGVSQRKKLVYIFLERLAANISAGIITVSHYDRHLAKKYKVASPEKVTTIHNGVPATKKEANPAIEPLRLVMVARFAEPKDQLSVITALSKLSERSWLMDFVGDGPLMEQARKYVSELGLTNRIRFLGNQRDIETILANSQIFVLVSNWEGLPLSILEAMRSGLPIIATDVGGVKETIKHGENGWLIQKGDQLELIGRLQQLIQSPELREEMGRSSKERYHKYFTFGEMMENTVSFYEKASAEDKRKRYIRKAKEGDR
ncbi:hypothetical protein CD798_03235 [Bacillaceae bacterium SAOS 7]|nr:hypothetical protein CD798_03235 [Bacillaceae bacterium SAOS 7]